MNPYLYGANLEKCLRGGIWSFTRKKINLAVALVCIKTVLHFSGKKDILIFHLTFWMIFGSLNMNEKM